MTAFLFSCCAGAKSYLLYVCLQAGFNRQEPGGDASIATPGAEEALSLNQSHRDLGSQDRLNVLPATEEPQAENTQDEHVAARGSPATAENVMLESEKAIEDAAGPLLFEEVCELYTEVETLKQGDQQHILRRKTVLKNNTTVERNYTQHSQKAGGETDEENTLSQVAIVAVTDTDPRETADMSDGVFALEKRRKKERQQLEDEELNHGDRTEKKEEFGVKGTVLEEISAEHPEDKQTEEQNQKEEEDQPLDRRLVETSTTELLAVVEDGRAEESEEKVTTSTHVRVESKDVDTKETAPEMDLEKEEVADDGAEERDVMTAADLHQPTVSVPEEHDQTKDGETPTPPHASVILVDLKTKSSHLNETSDVQRFASETEEVQPIAAERMDQKPEPASSEEGTEEPKEESSHRNHEEEDAPLIETIHLRSGRKIGKAGRQEQERDDTAAVRTCDQEHEAELVPAETKEETQALSKDGVTGEDPADQEESAEEASTLPEMNKEMRLEEDEAAVHLQPLTGVSENKTSGEDEAEAENQTNVPPEVDDGPVTLAVDQQNTADLTCPAIVQPSNPEDTFGASEEKQHEEEMDPQGSDLQRVEVVLVDLRNSGRSQEQTVVSDSCVDEEQPAAEMEEQNVKEALTKDEEHEAAADGPGEASDDPEEAVTTQSVEDDEAQGVSADGEVPIVDRRILRSGRKTGYARTPKGRSAAATPQRKPKRAHANRESAEQGVEEPKPDLEDVTPEELSKEGEVKEKDDGVGAAEKEEILQPHSEEDEETSRDEPNIVARKTKRSAPATSRRKSKRSRIQCESEEEPSAEDRDEEENKSDDGEIAEIENGGESVDQEKDEPKAEDKEMDVLSEEALREAASETRPSEQENSLREASSVPSTGMLGDADEEEEEEEAALVATPDRGSHGNGVKATTGTQPLKHQMEENEKETLLETGSGPGQPDTEETDVMKAKEQGNEVPEREEEKLAEEEETTSVEKVIKIDGAGDSESAEVRAAESENFNDEPPAEIQVLDPGTDADVESPTAAPEEDHQAEDDAGWSEVPGRGGHQPSGWSRAKEAMLNDTDENVESDLVTMETGKDKVMNLEPNTDEDEDASTSEEEEDPSDDDGELTVIGKKVLRGRTVPAIITPQRKASPQPSQKKRKRPDNTPARQSKRRSRV